MKKLLLALVIVGAGGYFAWARLLRPPARRACAHVVTLCHHDSDISDEKECLDFFDTLGKNDAAGVAKVADCMAEANSCGEAVGCYAGGAIRLGTGFARDVVKGIDKSMK
jgi:hypothetical protein